MHAAAVVASNDVALGLGGPCGAGGDGRIQRRWLLDSFGAVGVNSSPQRLRAWGLILVLDPRLVADKKFILTEPLGLATLRAAEV